MAAMSIFLIVIIASNDRLAAARALGAAAVDNGIPVTVSLGRVVGEDLD
jgi:hypothetical protein